MRTKVMTTVTLLVFLLLVLFALWLFNHYYADLPALISKNGIILLGEKGYLTGDIALAG